MPVLRSQKDRPYRLHTPLGEDVLLLRQFSFVEELGRPFEIQAVLLSTDVDLKFEDVLGARVCITMKSIYGGEPRYINGFIVSLRQSAGMSRQIGDDSDNDADPDQHLSVYTARIVPWMWFLSRTTDCRIFQDLTVPEIIKEVFRTYGFSDFEDRLSGDYATLPFTVQYRESALDFVTRLMEREGIYSFLVHDEEKHTLVLADGSSAHEPLTDHEEIPFLLDLDKYRDKPSINSWDVVKEVKPENFALREFNFENPKFIRDSKTQHAHDHQAGGYEVYDYEGSYAHDGEGDRYVSIRREEHHATYETVTATTRDIIHIESGGTFTLTDPTHIIRDDQERGFIVTAVSFSASQDLFASSTGGSDANFECEFDTMPDDVPFRLARTTPQPVVEGPQTAEVVGSGDIDVDEHGRVKVQFHWDRYGKSDDTSSCRVRVSQNWAGKGWGGMFVPHVGQEVIVEFLEGDPNRPIITGRVYNGANPVPLELGANKTKSIIRDHGDNEMIMEGQDGEQFIHLQQSCGNEIFMDGSSGGPFIHLKQECGNYITMDGRSGEERIILHSPYDNSTFRIGAPTSLSGFFWETVGNVQEVIGGKWDRLVDGSMHSNILGEVTSKFILGIKHQAIVGAEFKEIGGLKFEYHKGPKVSKHSGQEYTIANRRVVKKAKQDIALETKKALTSLTEDITNMQSKSKMFLVSNEAMVVASQQDEIFLSGEKKATLAGKEVQLSGTTLNFDVDKFKYKGKDIKFFAKLDIGSGTLKINGATVGAKPRPKKKPPKLKEPTTPEMQAMVDNLKRAGAM